MGRKAGAAIVTLMALLGLMAHVLMGNSGAAVGGARSSVAVPSGAQRVVLVGDSILDGAEHELAIAFEAAGVNAVIDAKGGRPTSAGEALVATYLETPADALVVVLGANDARNTAAFSASAFEVLRRAHPAPRVYWVTIPEVESYYADANRVIENLSANRSGMKALPWHEAVRKDPALTAVDGLHLTNSGANHLAFLVAGNVVADLRADALNRMAFMQAAADAHASSELTTSAQPPVELATAEPSLLPVEEPPLPVAVGTPPTEVANSAAGNGTVVKAGLSNAGLSNPNFVVVAVALAILGALGALVGLRRVRSTADQA